MNINAPLLFLCLCASLCAQAQTTDPRKVYDDFKRQAQQQYSDFRKSANGRYAEFIRQAWTQFNTLPAILRPKDEKVTPKVVPEGDKDKPIDNNIVPIKEVVTTPKPTPQPTPLYPIKEQRQSQETDLDFIYCGSACKVRINEAARFSLPNCGNEQLAEAWTLLSQDGVMNNTIRDCLSIRINRDLCDWAYLNLLSAFAKKVYGEGNEATLLMAYIYCQSGYKMRLGRNDNCLFLLYASEHGIYDLAYFNVDDAMFYPFECSESRMEICNIAFPQEKSLSLLVTKPQKFDYAASSPRLLTSKRYPNVQAEVQVNKNLIDFYNTYPSSEIDGNFMTRWAMYANTPLDENIVKRLYPKLRMCVEGVSQLDAVNKLLNWVQTAFVYEYDDKVWGHDRAFFAEEALFYPYCDCEDRAILFTRLVRDLLGLKTILVYYPGHLASAVCFSGNVPGDYIALNGKRFVISDPTYIGAPVGMTMPDMDNNAASVILLE